MDDLINNISGSYFGYFIPSCGLINFNYHIILNNNISNIKWVK